MVVFNVDSVCCEVMFFNVQGIQEVNVIVMVGIINLKMVINNSGVNIMLVMVYWVLFFNEDSDYFVCFFVFEWWLS